MYVWQIMTSSAGVSMHKVVSRARPLFSFYFVEAEKRVWSNNQGTLVSARQDFLGVFTTVIVTFYELLCIYGYWFYSYVQLAIEVNWIFRVWYEAIQMMQHQVVLAI